MVFVAGIPSLVQSGLGGHRLRYRVFRSRTHGSSLQIGKLAYRDALVCVAFHESTP
jgi:hypothetical protein